MFQAVNRNHRAKLAVVIQHTSGAREVAGTGNALRPLNRRGRYQFSQPFGGRVTAPRRLEDQSKQNLQQKGR